MRGLHNGILVGPKLAGSVSDAADVISGSTKRALPLDDPAATTSMPETWARASMLVRLNSLASGASGIKVSTIEALALLIEEDIVPRIPLRGSISASGDLSPLSYIGGLMQGKPSITVWIGDRSKGTRRIQRADYALAQLRIAPVKYGPKEGLAIVNGTSVSAGVAALAMQEAHGQAVVSQVLTAMTVEALRGTDESCDPFFAQVRPHPGQIESARNIFGFLTGSKLVHRNDGSDASSLRQDRYSIRTASQWIGPVLEDLLLAHQQVTIELNSVTDNPLVDTSSGRMMHGGNFQAKVITSAMEKVRQGCQTLGRMLFAQCTELMNPATNRNLPPNLVVDEPSESFMFKGIDVQIAALQSELGFLANPVGTHVQSAEMGNQAINSLALISARYTLDSLQVLTQLSAAHFLATCQALDLRAMHLLFLETLRPYFFKDPESITHDPTFPSWPEQIIEPNLKSLWNSLSTNLDSFGTLDSSVRFEKITRNLLTSLLATIVPKTPDTIIALEKWTTNLSAFLTSTFHSNRNAYLLDPDATSYLGTASARLYNYIRKDLKVPFLQEVTVMTPHCEPEGFEFGNGTSGLGQLGTGVDQDDDVGTAPTIGSHVTKIYESMRSGELYEVVGMCLKEV